MALQIVPVLSFQFQVPCFQLSGTVRSAFRFLQIQRSAQKGFPGWTESDCRHWAPRQNRKLSWYSKRVFWLPDTTMRKSQSKGRNRQSFPAPSAVRFFRPVFGSGQLFPLYFYDIVPKPSVSSRMTECPLHTPADRAHVWASRLLFPLILPPYHTIPVWIPFFDSSRSWTRTTQQPQPVQSSPPRSRKHRSGQASGQIPTGPENFRRPELPFLSTLLPPA